jgi:hypothetical protein
MHDHRLNWGLSLLNDSARTLATEGADLYPLNW